MGARRWLLLGIGLIGLASVVAAEEVAGLPLHVDRLGPGTIRVWVGDHISSTAVVALATEKGIVVVDTFGMPAVDRELRRVVARELQREDFAYLVNTHEHGDHTGGNGYWADCTIVGHELVAAGMAANQARRGESGAWMSRRVAELEQEVARQADPAASARAREELTRLRVELSGGSDGPAPVPPSLTFSDRMTLDLGDTTLELYFIGGMHSASDVAVLVPERGLLLTGDTMADVWLTDTPGCLASFAARDGVRHDFPLLLANWEAILAQKDRIRDLVPGHWNGDLTLPGCEARVAYVRAMWDGVNAAVAAGRSLAEVQAEYRLDSRFPDLASSPGFNARNHGSTLLEMWKVAAHQESGAARLYALLDQGADAKAIREVMAERDRPVPRYFFNEAEANALGYRFLQDGKVDRAAALFRLNVELFPDSWNVYDSLGEALLAAGQAAEATAMYERSVALNPENRNGQEALARIRAGAR